MKILPPGPWTARRATIQDNSPFAWHASKARPLYNITAADGQWIARVAAETQEQAAAIAHAVCSIPPTGKSTDALTRRINAVVALLELDDLRFAANMLSLSAMSLASVDATQSMALQAVSRALSEITQGVGASGVDAIACRDVLWADKGES